MSKPIVSQVLPVMRALAANFFFPQDVPIGDLLERVKGMSAWFSTVDVDALNSLLDKMSTKHLWHGKSVGKAKSVVWAHSFDPDVGPHGSFIPTMSISDESIDKAFWAILSNFRPGETIAMDCVESLVKPFGYSKDDMIEIFKAFEEGVKGTKRQRWFIFDKEKDHVRITPDPCPGIPSIMIQDFEGTREFSKKNGETREFLNKKGDDDDGKDWITSEVDLEASFKSKRFKETKGNSYGSQYGDYITLEKQEANEKFFRTVAEMGLPSDARLLCLDAEQMFTSRVALRLKLFEPARIYVPNPDPKICDSLRKLSVCAIEKTFAQLAYDLGFKMDAVFYDSCSTFEGSATFRTQDDIKMMFAKRKFAQESVFGMEICGRRPQATVHGEDPLEDQVEAFVKEQGEVNGYMVEPVHIYSYKNTLSSGSRGALMWVFIFRLTDMISTKEERLDYGKRVFEREAKNICFGKKLNRQTRRYFIEDGDRGHIVFPKEKCSDFALEYVIPSLSSSSHAYCSTCDEEACLGKKTQKKRKVLHKPVKVHGVLPSTQRLF